MARRCFGTWPKMRPLRIRVLSMDVTGTLVSFRGSLAEHYLGSAEKCGVELPPTIRPIGPAFQQAYKEISHLYPCFGHDVISGRDWWRHCVVRSFELAGATMTAAQQDRVFQRIYSVFGSHVAYERFEDALPFLHWAQRNHVACGLLSNADERYRDNILPMLELTPDELQFQCFSKEHGLEKPDGRFFDAALREAQKCISLASSSDREVPRDDPLLPCHVLHIGNDFVKDFEGARRAGMHAVLLDRYNETELAAEWRRRGAVVVKDLLDVVEFLGRCNCQLGSSSATKGRPRSSRLD